MRFCISNRQNIEQYIGNITAGCSYQHTSFPTVLRVHIVQNSKEYFEKWIKYLKLKKQKQDGRYSSGLYKKWYAPHMFGYPLYIQNTKSMLCQTKGVSICPIHLDAPICLDAPVCLDTPMCLAAPVCLDAPMCLDGSLYVWTPPYV